MVSDYEIAYRASNCVDNLLQCFAAVRGAQEVALINRYDEIIKNEKTEEDNLYSDSISSLLLTTSIPYHNVKRFFRDIIDKQEPFHAIFYFRYGVHHDDIIDLSCDISDNQEFWNGFKQDLNGGHTPERTVLAFTMLILLTEINQSKKLLTSQSLNDLKNAETKRALDLITGFYFAEIRYQEAEARGQEALDDLPPSRIQHEEPRMMAIHKLFPLNRDLWGYSTQNIPDILWKVNDFLKPFIDIKQADGMKKLVNFLLDEEERPSAEIIPLKRPRPA